MGLVLDKLQGNPGISIGNWGTWNQRVEILETIEVYLWETKRGPSGGIALVKWISIGKPQAAMREHTVRTLEIIIDSEGNETLGRRFTTLKAPRERPGAS
jgi:hypothetical protein